LVLNTSQLIVVAPLTKESLSLRQLRRGEAPIGGYDLLNLSLFGMYRVLLYQKGEKVVHWYPDGKPFVWEDGRREYIPPLIEYSGNEAEILLNAISISTSC